MNVSRNGMVIAAISGLALAVPALAQNALDRNLQQGSGGLNQPRPDFASELRFRNAVVTGNAPGGMSFRGDVGYRAPGEFFGQLGSNETYNFRRDTVYSGLGGMGLRGTDALQYQFAMTTGNAPPPNYAGLPIVSRSGSAATAEGVRREQFAGATPGLLPGDLSAGDIARQFGSEMFPLRSPSAYTSSRGLQPTVLGIVADQQGQQLGVTASTLRGISISPFASPRQQIETGVPRPEGESGLRGPRDPSQMEPYEREQGQREPSPLAAGSQQVTSSADRRVEARLSTAVDQRRSPYEQVVERMRREPGRAEDPQAAATEPDWQRRLAELRAEFARKDDPLAIRQAEPPKEGEREKLDPGPIPAGRGEFDPNTLDMLRRSGQLDRLAPEGFDAYSSAMRAAQELLAAGRYFDAEARFTTALGARPGDPMAAAGRVHAELGAGMFLSAALNLRSLLTQNPELAGVKYAPELLPAADRIPAIMNRLRELLSDPERQDPELGLLLAYLGHQVNDSRAIERGLKIMSEAQGDEQQGLRRMSELLRQVWMNPRRPETGEPAQPNPAPPQSPSK